MNPTILKLVQHKLLTPGKRHGIMFLNMDTPTPNYTNEYTIMYSNMPGLDQQWSLILNHIYNNPQP